MLNSKRGNNPLFPVHHLLHRHTRISYISKTRGSYMTITIYNTSLKTKSWGRTDFGSQQLT